MFAGLVDPAAGARMSLAEALTNLMWAPISQLKDVKCSCNHRNMILIFKRYPELISIVAFFR